MSFLTDCNLLIVQDLSNLVNNLTEGIQKINCKQGHEDKKCKTCGTKYKI